jgi:hypothetical protein
MGSYRLRRFVFILIMLVIAAIPASQASWDELPTLDTIIQSDINSDAHSKTWPELSEIEVKGRAAKTGYERAEFGNGWENQAGCSTRNRVLARDLTQVVIDEKCRVVKGELLDPYTGRLIQFTKGELTSDDVQIDHVVALSNAWQTGAQQLSYDARVMLANDPLNLLAVSGDSNEQKSDSDAASWLPHNKSFRCSYIKRQIAVKKKYNLWVTSAERDAMLRVLEGCAS